MKAFKCPYCGGETRYDISLESIVCDHCGSSIKREEYQKYLDENNLYQTNELVCPQCGGTLLSSDNTLATFCNFCGSFVEFTRKIIEVEKPQNIIPFKINKQKAIQAYNARIESSFFAPDWLKEKGETTINGVYIPYFIYSATSSGRGISTGNQVNKDGNRITVNTYDMIFEFDAEYKGIRFDAASSFPDALSESIDDFGYEEQQAFQSSYMTGFYADGSDVNEEDYSMIVEGIVGSDLENTECKHNNITFRLEDAVKRPQVSRTKALMPVWFHTYRKGDKMCYAAVNGQTGTAAADIPIDKKKYALTSVILAAVIYIALNLFFTFTPERFLMVSVGLLVIFGLVLYSTAKDVWVKQHYGDDLGRIGMDAFKDMAVLRLTRKSKNQKAPSSIRGQLPSQKTVSWYFRVPISVAIKSLFLVFLGAIISILIILLDLPDDIWYYAAGILNIVFSFIAAGNVIAKQNTLSTRDIPVFTAKRGGQG